MGGTPPVGKDLLDLDLWRHDQKKHKKKTGDGTRWKMKGPVAHGMAIQTGGGMTCPRPKSWENKRPCI